MIEVDLPGAVAALKRGEVVIYPTETFYGLGVDIKNPEAIESLFRLKGRGAEKPVSILIASEDQVSGLVREVDDRAARLMERFFPGPLTLVLPVRPTVHPRLHAGTGWIGIRQSSQSVAQALVESYGSPITTTSANISGEESGRSESQIRDYFSSETGIAFLPGGELPPSKGSTVVLLREGKLELIREGDIEFSKLNATIGQT